MNFGFVSTRFSGTDGVSLEALKWAEVLRRSGHRSFWFSGLSDRAIRDSLVVPEAHFEHPAIRQINQQVWHQDEVSVSTRNQIEHLAGQLGESLKEFASQFEIDCLIPQNALTIPMNLSLGLALSRFIRSSCVPAIAHHHDFYWERDRFSNPAATPFLEEAFPPQSESIHHVVINSQAQQDLKSRLGLESTLVPNVMDFDAPVPNARSAAIWRSRLGFSDSDQIFLQPTRIVPRKGIEHAIELLNTLDDPNHHLVISHAAGDEGFDYLSMLIHQAKETGVNLHLLGTESPSDNPDSETPSLSDFYQMADFVTYPSLYEGFGNALLEAVYFQKPILVNRYPVYIDDIEPAGFRFVTMDGHITPKVTQEVAELMDDKEKQDAIAHHNFEIARDRFGLVRLQAMLDDLIEGVSPKTR